MWPWTRHHGVESRREPGVIEVSSWVLAVDFGTSNTAAAHTGVRGHDIEAVPLSHRGNVMPSAVFVESDRSILVGDVARDRAQTNPAAYVPAPKRLVGQPTTRVAGIEVPVPTLIAAVLHSVIDRATRRHDGQPPQQLILTHPEAWSPQQIQTLLDAASQLGFGPDRVRTISEPRAAAHHYTRNTPLTAGERIAVFDFGGGTLDVAVLAATPRHGFDVVAARGDNRLGGRNLDAVIRQWVDLHLDDRDPDLLDYLRSPGGTRTRLALDDSIRRAKELLTETPTATVTIDPDTGTRHDLLLTRAELDNIIGGEIERGMLLARTVLHDAGVATAQDLCDIYLTGGSSRVPLVRGRLQYLGRVATLDDPKTVVARGALHALTTPTQPAAPTQQPEHPTRDVAETTRDTPTPAKRSSRGRWIAAAAAAAVIVLAAGAAVALTRAGNDTTATTTQQPAGSPTATTTASAPRDEAADEQAIRDLTKTFLAKAGSGTAADLNPMRCSTQQAPADSPPPTAMLTYTLGDFISVAVDADTASARFNIQETDAAGTRKGIMVGDYAYENDAWKWCGSSVQ